MWLNGLLFLKDAFLSLAFWWPPPLYLFVMSLSLSVYMYLSTYFRLLLLSPTPLPHSFSLSALSLSLSLCLPPPPLSLSLPPPPPSPPPLFGTVLWQDSHVIIFFYLLSPGWLQLQPGVWLWRQLPSRRWHVLPGTVNCYRTFRGLGGSYLTF